MSKRIIAYIDGFNLYFGLKDSNFRRYYWLNIQQMAQSFLHKADTLVATKYFTTRISRPENKRKRQSNYLEALGTLTDFEIFYGHYLDKEIACRKCKYKWLSHEEKMTDVNIATELLRDAFCDNFDTAFLFAADSDLVPPIRLIRELFPEKRIVAIFPPKRASSQLRRAAHAQLSIGRGYLKKSQFPQQVVKPDGYVLQRPEGWS